MYQPVVQPQLTEQQRETECRLADALGLAHSSVKAGSFEVMSTADGQVRVRWVGMATLPVDDLLGIVPDAVIV